MCGIAGLYFKTPALQPELGAQLAKMLEQLSFRGPDSAGAAFYRAPAADGFSKVSLYARSSEPDWNAVAEVVFERFAGDVAGVGGVRVRGGQATFEIPADAAEAQLWLSEHFPALTVLSAGRLIETYKAAGPPRQFIEDFRLSELDGSHALGHTRMATESRVSTEHSHPFSTGLDLCLVHNGSLSNHNRLRRVLQREGIVFRTDCDSEVAAGYLTWRLREGDGLERALERSMDDLDGFFTFAVGTAEGFAVLRDPIACKPAVMAETDDWVAIASEYRAIAILPGAADAETWEPEPGRVYSWGTAVAAA
ncbi:MAG: class II glutamine amidotransferase domain-containing protein [Solirubrobacteraceae bacterium]